ncbi:MAG: methionine--tRNA ligase [Candidatus Lariskella arthropodorum]
MSSKFYITTPIYYVNDVPHIGHAYTSLACDFIARFKRLDGDDAFFLTGTDEHGQKIEKTAVAKGIEPKEFVDKMYIPFKELCSKMNFSNSDFIRTTEERHVRYVQDIWKQLVASGDVYMGKYSGWYATRDEAFYSEDEIQDGKAPTGAPVEWVEEDSYFFRLSAWQDKLLDFYEQHPEFIGPESRRNEVISFVKSGLVDLSVSRTSFSWGIPVPGDESHVIYVWLDALFNYISAVASGQSSLWPCDLHVVGKDILRFHAVYWPAFLMALSMPLPKRIFAHGWWTNEGQKISKSLGNVIDPVALVDQYGLDYIRYFLMREINFGSDGNYSHQLFVQRVNSELANNIGNLVHRVMTFIYNNLDGVIPEKVVISQEDEVIMSLAYSAIDKVRLHVDKQEISAALAIIIELGSACNIYMEKNAPWRLRKEDIDRMNAVLVTLSECIRVIGILLQPVVPGSAAKILGIFNITEEQQFEKIHEMKVGLQGVSGINIQKPSVIFSRLEV